MEEKKNNMEPEENASQEPEKVEQIETGKEEQPKVDTVNSTDSNKSEEKKPFDKKNIIVYAAFGVALAVVITVIILLASGNKTENPEVTTPEPTAPQVTTPEVTTPAVTTPEETTPAGPTETVTFPSDEDDDPKQEDVFFD